MQHEDVPKELQHSLNALRKAGLEESKLDALRSRLLSFADAHKAQSASLSPFSMWSTLSLTKMAVAAMVCVVVLGGGVAFAAHDALPGDSLYPIKIHVNENVQQLFLFTPEAKIQHEITLSHKRVVELETLQERGELTPELFTAVQKEVDTHLLVLAEVEDSAVIEEVTAIKAATQTIATTLGLLGEPLEEVQEETTEETSKEMDEEKERAPTLEIEISASTSVPLLVPTSTIPEEMENAIDTVESIVPSAVLDETSKKNAKTKEPSSNTQSKKDASEKTLEIAVSAEGEELEVTAGVGVLEEVEEVVDLVKDVSHGIEVLPKVGL